MSPGLLGYTLAYNFDEEYLLVNVHSGAGVGHQWFIIRDDSDTVTPIEGLVYMGDVLDIGMLRWTPLLSLKRIYTIAIWSRKILTILRYRMSLSSLK